MKNSRNPYFDFLRGLAIIMVVGIHSMRGVDFDFDTLESVTYVLLRMLLNCAVPVFLAISGYFITGNFSRKSMNYPSFLRRQIPKVYVPCLVFSLPYLIMGILASEHSYAVYLGKFFLCGFSVYYFIALIIQYYALLPVFMRFNRTWGIVICALISAVFVITVNYLLQVVGFDLPLFVYAGPFPLWILFFMMGVYFSAHGRDYNIVYPLCLTLLGIILQIVEYKYWLGHGQTAVGIKLSSFIFSAGVVWLLFCKRVENAYSENIIFGAMNWIGGMSFGIYLLHDYIILAAKHVLPSAGWIVTWTAVVGISILIIWLVRLILPEKLLRHIGFR